MQRRSNLDSKIRLAKRALATVIFFLFVLRDSRAQQTTFQTSDNESGRKIVVSIAHRKLALVEDGKVEKIYEVAVGADSSPSPTGVFEISTRLVKPTYYHPGKVIPAGPLNPLGTRWIGLNTKGYGIHGTNLEGSIGKAASHGCIRMHRKDLEQLFALVQVGDQVEIRDDNDEDLASIFGELPDSAPVTDIASSIAVNGQ